AGFDRDRIVAGMEIAIGDQVVGAGIRVDAVAVGNAVGGILGNQFQAVEGEVVAVNRVDGPGGTVADGDAADGDVLAVHDAEGAAAAPIAGFGFFCAAQF